MTAMHHAWTRGRHTSPACVHHRQPPGTMLPFCFPPTSACAICSFYQLLPPPLTLSLCARTWWWLQKRAAGDGTERFFPDQSYQLPPPRRLRRVRSSYFSNITLGFFKTGLPYLFHVHAHFTTTTNGRVKLKVGFEIWSFFFGQMRATVGYSNQLKMCCCCW